MVRLIIFSLKGILPNLCTTKAELATFAVSYNKIKYDTMGKIDKLFKRLPLARQYPTVLIEQLYFLPASIPEEPNELKDFNVALTLLAKSFDCEVYIPTVQIINLNNNIIINKYLM